MTILCATKTLIFCTTKASSDPVIIKPAPPAVMGADITANPPPRAPRYIQATLGLLPSKAWLRLH